MNTAKIEDINKYGVMAQGKNELIKYLNDGKLTRKEAMLAKCYDCMFYYADGKVDCECEACPIHQYMPYNPTKPKSGRTMSPEQKKSAGERLAKSREGKK